MVAKCLKATPSDGSADTKFQTPRNDDGDVRITKIEPTHKDIVDLTWQKGAAGAFSIPGDVTDFLYVPTRFRYRLEAHKSGYI